MDAAILDRVHDYRLAARRAVEATDVGDRAQLLALLDLHDLAQREDDVVTRLWCERAIWAEAADFVLGDQPLPFGDRWERRQQQLRKEGYDRCPRCLSNVLTLQELQKMRRHRLERAEELERRQQAVRRG